MDDNHMGQGRTQEQLESQQRGGAVLILILAVAVVVIGVDAFADWLMALKSFG